MISAVELETLVVDSLQRSRWLRLRKTDSRWLLVSGVDYIARAPVDGDLAAGLQSHLSELVRKRYGNPLLIAFLLKVVLPIIVEIILKWWQERDHG